MGITCFNDLSCAEAERLALLLEELGEAQQAIGKILRHGYESTNPAFPGSTNRIALERELGDVLAAIQLMTECGDIVRASVDGAVREKLNRVGEWLHYQKARR